MSKVYFIEIDQNRAGQRVDNFLLSHLKGVPRNHVYRLLRKGEVRVNKGRVKAEYKLQPGDSVRIPPVRVAENPDPQRPSERVLRSIDNSILFEDKYIIVMNKPSGIAVHGGSGLSYGVIEALRALRPKETSLELVHRLDRDTSGCLVVAKRRSALRDLHQQWRENRVEKHYLVLVKGKWQDKSQLVDQPLRKFTLKSGERLVQISNDGQAAQSLFHLQQQFSESALVEVKLLTGRTHQIRVHAQSIGHPVAGDEKYGDKVFNRQMKNGGLNRLFLHARSLQFELANQSHHYDLKAPMSSELNKVLRNLQK